MTLHIPEGLLLTGRAADPFELAPRLREVGLRVATDAFWARVAERVVRHVDSVRAGLGPTVYRGRYDTLTEQVRAMARQAVDDATADEILRNPEYDLGVSVKVLRAAGSAALLGIVRAELSTYHQAFTELDGVEDYSWFAAEHAPVPAADWHVRRGTWESSLSGGRRSELGWTWNLFAVPATADLPATRDIDMHALQAALPSDEDRAGWLARAFAALEVSSAGRSIPDIVGDLMRARDQALPKARTLIAPLTAADWQMTLEDPTRH